MTQTETRTNDERGTAGFVPEESESMSSTDLAEATQQDAACSCPSCFSFDF